MTYHFLPASPLMLGKLEITVMWSWLTAMLYRVCRLWSCDYGDAMMAGISWRHCKPLFFSTIGMLNSCWMNVHNLRTTYNPIFVTWLQQYSVNPFESLLYDFYRIELLMSFYVFLCQQAWEQHTFMSLLFTFLILGVSAMISNSTRVMKFSSLNCKPKVWQRTLKAWSAPLWIITYMRNRMRAIRSRFKRRQTSLPMFLQSSHRKAFANSNWKYQELSLLNLLWTGSPWQLVRGISFFL